MDVQQNAFCRAKAGQELCAFWWLVPGKVTAARQTAGVVVGGAALCAVVLHPNGDGWLWPPAC